MKCLTTVSYSVVVNEYIGESFQPTRGLRQRDPLSPFLFLICGEGLSCLMRLVCREGLVKGAKASRNGAPKLVGTDHSSNTNDEDKREVVNILGAAKGLLNNGLCWRVGKGDGISIWEDRWLPGKEPEEWNSRNRSEEYKLVSELIDPNTRMWKTDIIMQIMQIPLAKIPPNDIQMWKGESTGEFTVRSAYKLLQEASMDPSYYYLQADSKNFYKKLWNLRLP
ncbi:hypothetical protein PVK06_028419 [Gossypium arboreum]|uniref:Reverse transcriptase n=1 Tax=Gossypium arboreum TaxID=29729 RepID=A0ABR0P366_GOSAR|nr:hypothetical protein PVK06_028419 [Gossypium arboreum]